MKILKLLLLTLILFSCRENSKNKFNKMESSIKSNDSSKLDILSDNEDCQTWLSKSDTILPNGTFIKYIKKEGTVKIEWGNERFKRILTNDYACDGAPSWIPTIRWSTTKHLGLKYGCGSPCWGTIILPLNQKDSVIERMYDLEKDLTNNKIVYLDNESYDRIIVENYETGYKTIINYEFRCKAAFTGYCIDTLIISKDSLKINWLDWKDDGKTSFIFSESFKINE